MKVPLEFVVSLLLSVERGIAQKACFQVLHQHQKGNTASRQVAFQSICMRSRTISKANKRLWLNIVHFFLLEFMYHGLQTFLEKVHIIPFAENFLIKDVWPIGIANDL